MGLGDPRLLQGWEETKEVGKQHPMVPHWALTSAGRGSHSHSCTVNHTSSQTSTMYRGPSSVLGNRVLRGLRGLENPVEGWLTQTWEPRGFWGTGGCYPGRWLRSGIAHSGVSTCSGPQAPCQRLPTAEGSRHRSPHSRHFGGLVDVSVPCRASYPQPQGLWAFYSLLPNPGLLLAPMPSVWVSSGSLGVFKEPRTGKTRPRVLPAAAQLSGRRCPPLACFLWL